MSRGFSAKYSVMYSKVYNRQKADSLPPVVLRYNRVDQFLLNVVVASHEFIWYLIWHYTEVLIQ